MKKKQRGSNAVCGDGLFVMSFLNVYEVFTYALQHHFLLDCLSGYLVARGRKQNLFLIHSLLMPIITVTFTYYVIIGGNNGFAALWLIIYCRRP